MAKFILERGDRFFHFPEGPGVRAEYGIVTSVGSSPEGFFITGGGKQAYTMRTGWLPDELTPVGPQDKIPFDIKLALDAAELVLGLKRG